ncbi:MAG TPA: hypothetical protein ENJ69_02225, partial [Bacteroidetes bacterium]|nr:hypothetical protein [Bacteroidota bacterium]
MRKEPVVKWMLILILNALSLNLLAQSDSLSQNPARFYEQLSAILRNTKSPVYQAKANTLLARWGSRWNNKGFTPDEQKSVWQVTERMRSKKLRTYPYLYQYLYGITLLSETHRNPEEFRAWQRYVDEMLKQRKLRDFLNFLDFSKNLLEGHLLYGKATATWHFRRADFILHYDTAFYVVFKHLNLIKASRNDSVMIRQTRGTFFYPANRWEGEGGHLLWNRFASDWNEKYSIADSYRFKLNTNVFSIDSVQLTFPSRLGKQRVTGRLTDRVLTGKPGENSVYPRFVSYDSHLFIP